MQKACKVIPIMTGGGAEQILRKLLSLQSKERAQGRKEAKDFALRQEGIAKFPGGPARLLTLVATSAAKDEASGKTSSKDACEALHRISRGIELSQLRYGGKQSVGALGALLQAAKPDTTLEMAAIHALHRTCSSLDMHGAGVEAANVAEEVSRRLASRPRMASLLAPALASLCACLPVAGTGSDCLHGAIEALAWAIDELSNGQDGIREAFAATEKVLLHVGLDVPSVKGLLGAVLPSACSCWAMRTVRSDLIGACRACIAASCVEDLEWARLAALWRKIEQLPEGSFSSDPLNLSLAADVLNAAWSVPSDFGDCQPEDCEHVNSTSKKRRLVVPRLEELGRSYPAVALEMLRSGKRVASYLSAWGNALEEKTSWTSWDTALVGFLATRRPSVHLSGAKLWQRAWEKAQEGGEVETKPIACLAACLMANFHAMECSPPAETLAKLVRPLGDCEVAAAGIAFALHHLGGPSLSSAEWTDLVRAGAFLPGSSKCGLIACKLAVGSGLLPQEEDKLLRVLARRGTCIQRGEMSERGTDTERKLRNLDRRACMRLVDAGAHFEAEDDDDEEEINAQDPAFVKDDAKRVEALSMSKHDANDQATESLCHGVKRIAEDEGARLDHKLVAVSNMVGAIGMDSLPSIHPAGGYALGAVVNELERTFQAGKCASCASGVLQNVLHAAAHVGLEQNIVRIAGAVSSSLQTLPLFAKGNDSRLFAPALQNEGLGQRDGNPAPMEKDEAMGIAGENDESQSALERRNQERIVLLECAGALIPRFMSLRELPAVALEDKNLVALAKGKRVIADNSFAKACAKAAMDGIGRRECAFQGLLLASSANPHCVAQELANTLTANRKNQDKDAIETSSQDKSEDHGEEPDQEETDDVAEWAADEKAILCEVVASLSRASVGSVLSNETLVEAAMEFLKGEWRRSRVASARALAWTLAQGDPATHQGPILDILDHLPDPDDMRGPAMEARHVALALLAWASPYGEPICLARLIREASEGEFASRWAQACVQWCASLMGYATARELLEAVAPAVAAEAGEEATSACNFSPTAVLKHARADELANQGRAKVPHGLVDHRAAARLLLADGQLPTDVTGLDDIELALRVAELSSGWEKSEGGPPRSQPLYFPGFVAHTLGRHRKESPPSSGEMCKLGALLAQPAEKCVHPRHMARFAGAMRALSLWLSDAALGEFSTAAFFRFALRACASMAAAARPVCFECGAIATAIAHLKECSPKEACDGVLLAAAPALVGMIVECPRALASVRKKAVRALEALAGSAERDLAKLEPLPEVEGLEDVEAARTEAAARVSLEERAVSLGQRLPECHWSCLELAGKELESILMASPELATTSRVRTVVTRLASCASDRLHAAQQFPS